MASRCSSQRLTVISFLYRGCRTHHQVCGLAGARRAGRPGSPVLLMENAWVLREKLIHCLPVPAVAMTNHYLKIVARRTMTPRQPNTHD
jgi:hypothetical protein